ncbi:MAG: glycoside hydrolase family 3 C-terminal domain-containing protein [Atopobiaceae bacterium]|nr:glycoside hydrolase family 3 C-terminal domain-containing protein [Atopobiaceae bacterium]MDD4381226.1 glycoside hydrolase family 3 C-terminal domain-containing protein [Atopobiaceae bacterium]
MIGINMADVISALQNCIPYGVFFLIVAVAAIVVAIAVRKKPRPLRKFIRTQSLMGVAAALVIAVNLICFIPMSNLLTLSTGAGAEVSDETTQEARQVGTDVTDEGIVMLKNDDSNLPLSSSTKKVNVFGWSSTSPCYGGTGSGGLNDNYDTTTLIEGLNDAGIETNSELTDFYSSYGLTRPADGSPATGQNDYTTPEPPVDTYSDQLLSDCKDYSDTAIVVISRIGGEGNDLPKDMSQVNVTNNSSDYNDWEAGQSYLELSQSEKNMINMVCSEYDDVTVVYTGANTMEMGWVNDYPQIKSVLWVAGAGQSGFDSLGKVLTGEVNPSGKTSDTFVYDLTDQPSYNNSGDFEYDNMDEYKTTSQMGPSTTVETTPSFVDYTEGIYVGYKYYETASTEGVLDYGSTVQYPFGYGLSYTSFSQKMGDIQKDADGTISFDVTVTNTGSVAGKDAVEVYYNPPYTNGGIEKSSANLITYAKTDEIQPGASQTVHISFSQEDMASYDESGEGSYVLEAGDYQISINSDSHTILDQRTYVAPLDIRYSGDNKRSSDETAATNEFQDAEGDVTYLSRADHFANKDAALAAPTNYSMTDEQKASFTNTSTYDASADDDPNATMPTTGANNGVTLSDLRGKDYDDSLWDTLLDQLTTDDMNNLIGNAGYNTASVASVGKVSTTDCDGPSAINNNFSGKGSIGLPSETTLACTWNSELANEYGECIGKMANEMDVSGWYGPAMNTHRSAFGGRNFEYYSEDGTLAGEMAAQEVSGAADHGVYAYIKHFALNDQETNRCGMLCTWANEQSIREVYLKPFEKAVKEGGATAVMSSYNYIGTTWSGGNSNLLQNVLRNEWGFNGMVLTDYFGGYGYMNADQASRNGGDACLCTLSNGVNTVNDQSASGVQAMRTCAHDILYTTVNSNAYASDTGGFKLATWQIVMIVVDVVIAALVVLMEVLAFKRMKRRTAAGETAKAARKAAKAARKAAKKADQK